MTEQESLNCIRCGSWPSPLSPEALAAAGASLLHAGAANGSLIWIEDRPAERGRSVLMACGLQASATAVELLPPDFSIRSRVHEYGGIPWASVGRRLVASNAADQRLLRIEADGSQTPLTAQGCRYADGRGHPDGRWLFAVREDHRAGGEPVNAIVAVDVDHPGAPDTVLFAASDFVAAPRVSADGRWLAFIAWDHPNMPWDSTRLIVAGLDMNGDGGPRLRTTATVAGGSDLAESVIEPNWDGDGTLFFLSDRSGWWNLYRWREGRVEAVTALEAEIGAPLWKLGQSSYAPTADGRVLARINRDGTCRLALIEPAGGAIRELDLPFVEFASVGVPDGRTGFAIAGAVDRAHALIVFDLDRGGHRIVRSGGQAGLAPEAVSLPLAIDFPTRPGADGSARASHAWFYPPQLPGFGPRPGELPPLLMVMHGGPTGQSFASLRLAIQFWTTRGFAVCDLNYGGSTGYGRRYRERLDGQWGVVDLADAIAAVDHLVAAGRVDGGRVAIRGSSAGGFTVLAALAFSDRFAAGIDYYGVADLELLAADTHKFESRYLDRLVAPLPAGREIYRARSPLHHFGRCRAALIAFQGSEDKVVPPGQSRAIVDAARNAGCPVAFVEFEGEGHGFRQGPNIVRALQAELAFLGRVFGFEPAQWVPDIAIANADRLDLKN